MNRQVYLAKEKDESATRSELILEGAGRPAATYLLESSTNARKGSLVRLKFDPRLCLTFKLNTT